MPIIGAGLDVVVCCDNGVGDESCLATIGMIGGVEQDERPPPLETIVLLLVAAEIDDDFFIGRCGKAGGGGGGGGGVAGDQDQYTVVRNKYYLRLVAVLQSIVVDVQH
ncbi:Glutamate receptor ionotropic, kainate 4, variant 2 [Dermatophagoides farinae]|uniref:Glutamate receptor ionotropic, kainate 4, variant 2 n=1 Tax=Dermatophagoides farinae TaxID=6954 RepID=A0A922I5G5_DERFA|nr:Glutamate receptor ionotropic, kainate 4, variant 2 [Dermatophagoides farinae]